MDYLFLSGFARSGTSWLGKIFASHPDVLYHFEPFNLVDERQSLHTDLRFWTLLETLRDLVAKGEIEEAQRRFAKPLDRFMEVRDHCLDKEPFFPQPSRPAMMAIKEDFSYMPEVVEAYGKMIQIVRDPRAQLNSLWNHTQFGKHYGMISTAQRWAERNSHLLDLAEKRPDSFKVVKYEALVEHPMLARELLMWTDTGWHDDVAEFLRQSHAYHDKGAYSVLKSPDIVLNAWKQSLSPSVQASIIRAVRGSRVAVELYGDFNE